jgi:hypothetical protein
METSTLMCAFDLHCDHIMITSNRISYAACTNVTVCPSPRGRSGTQLYTKLTMQTRTMVGIPFLRWRAVALTGLVAAGTIRTCNCLLASHPIV